MRRTRRSWRAARFLVVDVETTGLDPRRDEVISFAAVPVEEGRIVVAEAVEGLVRPRLAGPSPTIEIHGIRPQDLLEAPSAPGALAPLGAAVRGRIVVAHGAWVERAFLAPLLRPHAVRLPRRLVDTAVLWRLLCLARGAADPGWRALGAVAEALGLPVHRPHEAGGDALTTAQAFLALATHLEAHGAGTVGAMFGARRRVEGWRLHGGWGVGRGAVARDA